MWETLVGQEQAVEALQRAAARPLHAYLLVGPRDSGVEDAARCFAGALVGGESDERAADLARRGVHPDVVEIVPEKTVISVEQVRELIVEAANVPLESERKVLLLFEAERLNDQSANALLKTLEEPPPRAVVVLITDSASSLPETIRSRCQRVDLRLLGEDDVRSALIAAGVPSERAELAARLAGGQLGRGRLIAGDFAMLRDTFVATTAEVDGTGATALRLAEALAQTIQDALSALAAQHEQDLAALDERLERSGYPDRTAARLRSRLREQLRMRERAARRVALMEGITSIESAYRDALAPESLRRNVDRQPLRVDAGAAARAFDACTAARRAFEFNPNEGLLLERLVLQLPSA